MPLEDQAHPNPHNLRQEKGTTPQMVGRYPDYVVQAFYSHPWAWNEIGFGGPAYPRGYGAFGSPDLGEKESWEAEESVHYDPVRDAQKRGLD
jgi:hypothetical protein